jgi:hypothetical protein
MAFNISKGPHPCFCALCRAFHDVVAVADQIGKTNEAGFSNIGSISIIMVCIPMSML